MNQLYGFERLEHIYTSLCEASLTAGDNDSIAQKHLKGEGRTNEVPNRRALRLARYTAYRMDNLAAEVERKAAKIFERGVGGLDTD